MLQQTRTIPIVFATVTDPVGSGFVPSLARPGGNVTGFTLVEPTMAAKWVELLKEIAPRVNRVAMVLKPTDLPVQAPTKFELVINLKTAKELGLTVTRDFLLIADGVIE